VYPYTLQWTNSFLNIAASLWGTCTPSNTWFLGPTRLSYTSGISIGSVISQGSQTLPTDRHTQADHATSCVANGRHRYLSLRCGLIMSSTAKNPNFSIWRLLCIRLLSFWHVKHRVINRIVHIELHSNSKYQQQLKTVKCYGN